MSKVVRSNGSKKTLDVKTGRFTTKKEAARTLKRSTATGKFKVDSSPAARSFSKAVSATHKRLYKNKKG